MYDSEIFMKQFYWTEKSRTICLSKCADLQIVFCVPATFGSSDKNCLDHQRVILEAQTLMSLTYYQSK